MDFLHRNANNQPQTVRSNSGSAATASASSGVDRVKSIVDMDQPRWLRIAFVVMLFSLTILMIAIAVLFWNGRTHEGQLVDEKKVQAVFLTNGQVYFGNITDINGQYVDLKNIYYLNSQAAAETDDKKAAQPTSFSLVKLGCELHGPNDQMVINREQVSFWENLSTDGKVAKAIDQWKSQNPNGQKCEDTTNSTQQSTSNSNTQNANSNTANTNGNNQQQ